LFPFFKSDDSIVLDLTLKYELIIFSSLMEFVGRCLCNSRKFSASFTKIIELWLKENALQFDFIISKSWHFLFWRGRWSWFFSFFVSRR